MCVDVKKGGGFHDASLNWTKWKPGVVMITRKRVGILYVASIHTLSFWLEGRDRLTRRLEATSK